MQFFIWAVNDPSKSQRLTNKIPNTKNEKYFSELFVRDVLEMFKTLQAIVIALDAHKKWKVSSHCWIHHALQTKGPEVTELELNLMHHENLRPSFHGTRRHPANFHRRKANNNSTQLWCLWITTTTNMAQYGSSYRE